MSAGVEYAHAILRDAVRERRVGEVVHVSEGWASGAAGQPVCRAAVVMVVGEDRGGRVPVPLLRLRVAMPTPAGTPAGSMDAEGWYRHHADRLEAANPDGTRRALDSFHTPYLAGVCPLA